AALRAWSCARTSAWRWMSPTASGRSPGGSRASSMYMELLRRPLGEDALQGAAMHLQPARGFGNIAVAEFENPLDMFPAHALGRHRLVRRRRVGGIADFQRPIDVICIGGFGQVIGRTGLHGRNGGRD